MPLKKDGEVSKPTIRSNVMVRLENVFPSLAPLAAALKRTASNVPLEPLDETGIKGRRTKLDVEEIDVPMMTPNTREPEEIDISVVSQNTREPELDIVTEKKDRGRLETTGVLRSRRAAEEERRVREEEEDLKQMALEFQALLGRGEGKSPAIDEDPDLLRVQPMEALAEGAGQCVAAIEYVANRSKNLKGTFVKDLRVATKALRVMMSTALARVKMAEGDGSERDSEFNGMRMMKAELNLLRREGRRGREKDRVQPSREVSRDLSFPRSRRAIVMSSPPPRPGRNRRIIWDSVSPLSRSAERSLERDRMEVATLRHPFSNPDGNDTTLEEIPPLTPVFRPSIRGGSSIIRGSGVGARSTRLRCMLTYLSKFWTSLTEGSNVGSG